MSPLTVLAMVVIQVSMVYTAMMRFDVLVAAFYKPLPFVVCIATTVGAMVATTITLPDKLTGFIEMLIVGSLLIFAAMTILGSAAKRLGVWQGRFIRSYGDYSERVLRPLHIAAVLLTFALFPY